MEPTRTFLSINKTAIVASRSAIALTFVAVCLCGSLLKASAASGCSTIGCVLQDRYDIPLVTPLNGPTDLRSQRAMIVPGGIVSGAIRARLHKLTYWNFAAVRLCHSRKQGVTEGQKSVSTVGTFDLEGSETDRREIIALFSFSEKQLTGITRIEFAIFDTQIDSPSDEVIFERAEDAKKTCSSPLADAHKYIVTSVMTARLRLRIFFDERRDSNAANSLVEQLIESTGTIFTKTSSSSGADVEIISRDRLMLGVQLRKPSDYGI